MLAHALRLVRLPECLRPVDVVKVSKMLHRGSIGTVRKISNALTRLRARAPDGQHGEGGEDEGLHGLGSFGVSL
jgi:hypothetical protein